MRVVEWTVDLNEIDRIDWEQSLSASLYMMYLKSLQLIPRVTLIISVHRIFKLYKNRLIDREIRYIYVYDVCGYISSVSIFQALSDFSSVSVYKNVLIRAWKLSAENEVMQIVSFNTSLNIHSGKMNL